MRFTCFSTVRYFYFILFALIIADVSHLMLLLLILCWIFQLSNWININKTEETEIHSHFTKLHSNSQQVNRLWIHYHWPQQHNLDVSTWVLFECRAGFVRVIQIKLNILDKIYLIILASYIWTLICLPFAAAAHKNIWLGNWYWYLNWSQHRNTYIYLSGL